MIIAVPTNNGDNFKEVSSRRQNAAYVKHLTNAGFDPILIPMECGVAATVAISDGLLLAGGIDISPIHYGLNNLASFGVDPNKDAHERALLHAFIAADKPVFGICRGHQLILREYMLANDDMDGILEYEEHMRHHAQTADLNMRRDTASHLVATDIRSLFNTNDMPGNELQTFPVNSMHHQSVTANFVTMAHGDGQPPVDFNYRIPPVRVYENFELVAWTVRGIIQSGPGEKGFIPTEQHVVVEAMKINWNGTKIMGVQWHPEEMGDIRIIENFFRNAVMADDLVAANIM